MLISYPVLGASQVRESDFGGRYPIAVFKDSMHEGLTSGWHGGLHLTVNGTSTTGPVVRAIADGTVVAYRVPTKKPEKKDELERHALNYGGSWTDDGFVLLKHEKECGKERPVVFYSLYMHLGKLKHKDLNTAGGETRHDPIDSKTGRPLKLKRKDEVGEAGRISGQTGQLHFEIFASDDDFKKFFPAAPSTEAPTPEGLVDPWGEMYYVIKAGRPYFRERPQGTTLPASDLTIPVDLRIGVTYREGRIVYRSLDDNGLELEHWEGADREAEYNLYGDARSLDRGKVSRAYELMRFARFMNWPDLEDDKKPSPARCWHYLPIVDGWVDLADDAVKKLSDADFPEWCWKKVDASKAGFDPSCSLCDVSKLLFAIDENGNGNLSELEFTNWRKQDANKALLNQMAVQFQSEWDGQDLSRWDWVETMWADPVKHEQAALKHKQEWVKAQKETAIKGKPELERRIKQVADWQTKLEGMKQSAEKALGEAVKKYDDADKAKKDFGETQKAALEPKAPKKQHDLAVAAKVKELTKNLSDALEARKQAEKKAKSFDTAIERAKAWKAREEMKLKAAEKVIQAAQPTLDQLDEAIRTSAKKATDPKAAEQAAKDFEEYKKHMAALQFWGKVPNLPNSKVWHFHPLHFIEFFKRCHWLSEGELSAIYSRTPRDKREHYRVALNRVMWKYGVNTPTRMTHFLGQGWVESGALTTMVERSSIFPGPSTANEDGGHYKNAQDYYYTNVQRYENLSWGGNIDKAELRDSMGNAVDTKAAEKKSDDEIATQIKKAKEEMTALDEQIKKLDDKVKQLAAQKPKDEKAIKNSAQALKDSKDALKTKKLECLKLEELKRNANARYKTMAEKTIDPTKSRSGDGMKFRGRGMKQLTARSNYAKYWVYRGWLDRNSFDDPWWEKRTLLSNGKRAPVIDDPQRISTIPFNCIDTGGWYWEEGKNKSLNHLIQESQSAGTDVISAISKAINGVNSKTGKPNGLDDRVKRTQEVAAVVLDKVD